MTITQKKWPIFLARYASRITRYVFLSAVLLTVASAHAGDLTTDNLMVTRDATMMGNMAFSSTASGTNAGGIASGGAITTNGNYRIHTFTNVGTTNFVVTGGSLACDVLVVAGGGGGGGGSSGNGGGGGGGGLIYTSSFVVTAKTYTVTIGGGGSGGAVSTVGGNGQNTVFDTLTAVGGGGGGSYNTITAQSGLSGGSGGGAPQYDGKSATAGGAGTTNQGCDGGDMGSGSSTISGSGGGGAGAAGSNATSSAGPGGVGLACSISGSTNYYAGGGGGSAHSSCSIQSSIYGGVGGGGNGAYNYGSHSAPTPGVANTGGGGGGNGEASAAGAAGGSGVVIVRYLMTASLSISSNGINQASASGVNVFMGKVGIGANNPAEKLHVLGNARVDGTNIVSAITLGGETRATWPTGSLAASNNLSDITSQVVARVNLGLGSAATNDTSAFDPAGAANAVGNVLSAHSANVNNPHQVTAAQVGALAAANNLSDAANKATARANLGLGSAATNDANAFLAPTGNGSQLTGITAEQVGALSTNFILPQGDLVMGAFTNR